MRHLCRVTGLPAKGDRIALDEEESRHLLQVLRARDGAEVGLRNGAGLVAEARIVAAGRRVVEVEVLAARVVPPPAARVALVLAALRNSALDPVLEKAVEMGASAVEILETERAVAGLDARDKSGRWERILIAAMKQSGTPWLPEVRAWPSVEAFLARGVVPRPLLLCDLAEGAEPAAKVLVELAGRAADGVSMIVGPEGDFSPDERGRWLDAGARPVSLGPAVLRAETAAVLATGLALRILSDCRELPA